MAEIKTLSQLLEVLKQGYRIPNKIQNDQPLPRTALLQKMDERHFRVLLAGHVIAVDSMYAEVHSLCKNYLCSLKPEIRIAIEEADIAYERQKTDKDPSAYADSYLETLAVYRKTCDALLPFDTFLMHGAVVAIRKTAYMFTAESGTGKTTHIRKWLDRLEDAYIVNGDKPLIKMTDTEAIACGSPWCGKEQMETNTMVPLKAIVFMERGDNNVINEVSYDQIFINLLKQTYQPNDAESMKKTLHLLLQLRKKVRFFRFVFNNMKPDAFDVAYQALTEGKK